MADDESEDLIDYGSDRRALLGARVRRHPLTRALLALAVLAVIVAALRSGSQHRSAPRAGSTTPSPQLAPASEVPDVADSSLYTVPPQDLRAYLNAHTRTCRAACTTEALAEAALRRATASFAGMTPLAGALVRERGAIVFETIEARARPDSLVHLILVRIPTPTTTPPVQTDHDEDGARIVTIRQVRAGWRLTATIVVRGTVPPSHAALAWSASTRLPV